jgi:hypothetical protein
LGNPACGDSNSSGQDAVSDGNPQPQEAAKGGWCDLNRLTEISGFSSSTEECQDPDSMNGNQLKG